jgi:dephospho-CoA kinase
MSLRIGVTGGIGAGKTTVCELFARFGVSIIDADEIARQLVSPGQPALQAIVQAFGEDLLDIQGQLRRDQLRTLVFSDQEKRERLERILHPLIIQEMEHRAGQCHTPYCILSIPLLTETGLRRLVHRVLVIDCPETLQLQRVMDRDHLTADEVKAIIRAQSPRAGRLNMADDMIVNDAGTEKLEKQVAKLHKAYMALASQIGPHHGSRFTRR